MKCGLFLFLALALGAQATQHAQQVVLDVRSESAYAAGHAHCAVSLRPHIPHPGQQAHQQALSALAELRRGADGGVRVVVYGDATSEIDTAMAWLHANNYQDVLSGGEWDPEAACFLSQFCGGCGHERISAEEVHG